MPLTAAQVLSLNKLPESLPELAKHRKVLKLGDLLAATEGGGEALPIVRFATTANIASLAGLSAVDGVTPVEGDHVLVKNQSTASQNGIYAASGGAWSRVKDAEGNDILAAGMLVSVSEGTAGGGKFYVLTTAAPLVVGTTSLTFSLFAVSGVSALNLASNANALGASLVGIEDSAGLITATTVEAALAEIAAFDQSVIRVSITLTPGEASAGKHVIADAAVPAGKQFFLQGLALTVGGATAWTGGSLTKLTLRDTAGSPVALADIASAQLTGNAVIASLAATGVTAKAAVVTGGTVANGIDIIADNTASAGSTITLTIWGRFI